MPTRQLSATDPLCMACGTGQPGKDADSDVGTCQICLDPYEEGNSVKTLPCFHSYHQDCVDDWLRRSGICPICRCLIHVPQPGWSNQFQ